MHAMHSYADMCTCKLHAWLFLRNRADKHNSFLGGGGYLVLDVSLDDLFIKNERQL